MAPQHLFISQYITAINNRIFKIDKVVAGLLRFVRLLPNLCFMRYLMLLCGCFFTFLSFTQTIAGANGEQFTERVVASHLSDPWEVTYGPDGYLWITEAKGYMVSRINSATGKKTVVLDVSAQRQFPRYDKMKEAAGEKPWPQGGLMGLALHPQLLSGKPYVYIAYHYRFAGAADTSKGCAINFGGCFYTARIVRYEYDRQAQQLIRPQILCDSIPASSDHDGGRLLIASVNAKNYLFHSIGDMGAGQFGNAGRTNHAQQKDDYEGKILRFNTEPDGDTNAYDKWIPNDNPFSDQKQNAVYSYGHRNPQGLAYAIVGGIGRMYESEHGPYSDDEVNIIEKGKNYGHPLVLGYADGNYDGLAAGVTSHQSLPGIWQTTYPTIGSETENAKRIGNDYRDPILTLYPNTHSFLTTLYDSIKIDTGKQEWASEAPSSIEVYTSDAIPGWKNSLLLPSLKNGHLIRLNLNENGTGITGDTVCYFKAQVRYRDIAISPDGKTIYVVTDSASVSSGPSAEDPKQVSYKGCLLAFHYEVKNEVASSKNLFPKKEEVAGDKVIYKREKPITKQKSLP